VIVVEAVGGGAVISEKTTPSTMTVYLAYGVTRNAAFPSESDVSERLWTVQLGEGPPSQQQKVVFSKTVTF